MRLVPRPLVQPELSTHSKSLGLRLVADIVEVVVDVEKCYMVTFNHAVLRSLLDL